MDSGSSLIDRESQVPLENIINMISGMLCWRRQKWSREYKQKHDSKAILRTNYLETHNMAWASEDEGEVCKYRTLEDIVFALMLIKLQLMEPVH